VRGFIKDIRERFTRLNQNQRIILLATAFLIVLNFIILILSIDIIFRVLELIDIIALLSLYVFCGAHGIME